MTFAGNPYVCMRKVCRQIIRWDCHNTQVESDSHRNLDSSHRSHAVQSFGQYFRTSRFALFHKLLMSLVFRSLFFSRRVKTKQLGDGYRAIICSDAGQVVRRQLVLPLYPC